MTGYPDAGDSCNFASAKKEKFINYVQRTRVFAVGFPSLKIPNSRRVRKTQSLVGFATRMLLAAQKPDPTAIQCQRMLMTQRRVHSSKSGTKHRKRHYQCLRLRIFYYAIILLQASQNRSPASDAPFFHEFSSSDAADAAASEDFDLMTVGLFCFVFI